jgi:site-specific DNA-methyltransferase (adenine-specific)
VSTIQIGDATLHRGEALSILQTLADDSVDAILTDPPYSSGGLSAGQRQRPPSEKYQQTSAKKRHYEFLGDNRDQRSFMAWATLWLAEGIPGGQAGIAVHGVLGLAATPGHVRRAPVRGLDMA